MSPRAKSKATILPSQGPAAHALGAGTPLAAVVRLAEAIAEDGGSVLATYRDPLRRPIRQVRMASS